MSKKSEKLKFVTSSTKVGGEWWDWQVHLNEPEEILSQIKHVEYVLHPTFPDRIRKGESAENGFALKAGGWGEFDIVANVHFKNGDEKTLIVPLKLSES